MVPEWCWSMGPQSCPTQFRRLIREACSENNVVYGCCIPSIHMQWRPWVFTPHIGGVRRHTSKWGPSTDNKTFIPYDLILSSLILLYLYTSRIRMTNHAFHAPKSSLCTRGLRPSSLRPVPRHQRHRNQQARLTATKIYSEIAALSCI